MKKIVLITGGTRGLGKAIALRLAKAGYDIWITYQSRDDRARETQNEVEQAGAACRLLKFDIRCGEVCKETLTPLLAEQTPWALINNAGITRDGLFIRMDEEQWNSVLATALDGFFNVTKPVVAAMMKKKEGRVVNISSVVGLSGNAGQVNYASAKAGLIGATKALAQEVARRNILVNCIAPGFVETEMTEGLNQEKLLAQIPLGRVGRPDEIAGAVEFLIGESSTYITGQVLGVNGGMY